MGEVWNRHVQDVYLNLVSVNLNMAIGEDISEDKTRPVSRPKQKCNLAKIKQRLEEQRTKEENMKIEEEKLRPTFHNLSVKMIEYNF